MIFPFFYLDRFFSRYLEQYLVGPTDTEASKDSDSAPGTLALREPCGSGIQFLAILVKLMIN